MEVFITFSQGYRVEPAARLSIPHHTIPSSTPYEGVGKRGGDFEGSLSTWLGVNVGVYSLILGVIFLRGLGLFSVSHASLYTVLRSHLYH